MEPLFTARGIIKEAYALMKPKLWTVVGQFTAMFLVFMALSFLFNKAAIFSSLVSLLYGFCMTVFGLSYAEKGTFSLKDIGHSLTLKKFAYFLVAGLLVGLAVIGGMILLIVPGIIFAIQMCMYKYTVIDQDASPIASIKSSIRMTKGSRWALFRFFILSGLLVLLGVICLGVGALIAMPIVTIANALIYKKLKARATVAETVTKETPSEPVTVEATPVPEAPVAA